MYAEVILPVPLPTVFSYRIPEEMVLVPGMRVLVPLGPRTKYKGIVYQILQEVPDVMKIRDIEAVLDPYPLVGPEQLSFWDWLADYYMCTLGEVFRTAMPRGLKDEFSPRYEVFTQLAPSYRNEEALNRIFDSLTRAPKQLIILQRLAELLLGEGGLGSGIPKKALVQGTDFSVSAYKGLLKKKIITEYSEQAARMQGDGRDTVPPSILTSPQQTAYNSIRKQFETNPVVLLKGVTSSGKTEVYIHLISEVLNLGKQVLYLLPEIALTAQIVERLRNVFGDRVGVYHSKYPDSERSETFLRARENPIGKEYAIILGARSAVFLPFRDLGLVIIDEEHEQSYKQADPAPRYHARDAAIVLAEKYGARVLLGSATPSFESFHNARKGKFGLVELKERFGAMDPPEVQLINLKEAYRKKRMVSHFTPELYEEMKNVLEDGRQVILFQNRRGFAPYIECFDCNWIPECRNCDVNLTYHKKENRLVCHYCGYSEGIRSTCPDCSSGQLVTRGFGTEKLEEEAGGLFPEYRLVRMDLDTTRSRKKYERIIRDFELGSTRILIGTQIVTKGLDFDDVGLVGVLNADNMMNFPDFRSFERSYQLISQVAGRSGRKGITGRIIVQTSQPEHPVMQQVLKGEYLSAYMSQMEDRQAFHYPPYYRLIRIILKHANRNQLDRGASELAGSLRTLLRTPGKTKPEVLGPQSPVIGRIQQMHHLTILVKLPRTPDMAELKGRIGRQIEKTVSSRKYGKLFIIPDVDPY